MSDFEQYKADEAICDGECDCAHCRNEKAATEMGLSKPAEVFSKQSVQLEGSTIQDMLARVLRWQYQNSSIQPLTVSYMQLGDWHTAIIEYIEPFNEES